MLRAVAFHNSKCLLVIVSTFVLRLKAAELFQWPVSALKSTAAWKCKKSGLRDVKRADFIRCWRRSG